MLENLHVALLACKSMMPAAIQALERAHRFEMRLEVSGLGNPGYNEFVRIARQLGVRVEECKLPPNYGSKPYDWAFDHGTKNLRAWIPEVKDRAGDYHVWLPFCYEHHTRRLRERQPDLAMPQVDSLYLLLLWSDCFGPAKVPISARVLKDIVTWETIGEISANRYSSTLGDEVARAYHQAWELPRFAQMYLGIWTGREGLNMCERAGMSGHPFNKRTSMILQASTPDVASHLAAPAWLVRLYSWPADETAVILNNSWVHYEKRLLQLSSAEDLRMTEACLKHRLKGHSEAEIAEEMGFEDCSAYGVWLAKHALDIDSSRYRHPYERWVEACQLFGLEPSDGLVDSLTFGLTEAQLRTPLPRQGSDEVSLPVEEPVDPRPGFRHSPDFRSITLPDDRQLSLTERQAEVISRLYENLENGTPELSQSFLVEEVYPGVSEKRLRRLFNDNEVYDLLIESGSKRGLVRLRTEF